MVPDSKTLSVAYKSESKESQRIASLRREYHNIKKSQDTLLEKGISAASSSNLNETWGEIMRL
jgi:hypothetical protein